MSDLGGSLLRLPLRLSLLALFLALAFGCEPEEQAGDVVQLQLSLDQPAEPDPFGRGGSTYKVAVLELMGTAGELVVFSEVVDFDQSAEGLTTLNIPEITGARGELSFPIEDVTLTLNGYNGGGELVAQGVSQPVDLVLGAPVAASMLFSRLGTFSQLGASLGKARWGHTATELEDGSLLVFGGSVAISDGAPDGAIADAELFDPVTLQTSVVTSTGLTPRVFHTATAVAGGVLVAGGLDAQGQPVGSAVFYDATSGTFGTEFDIEPRAAHAAAPYQDGVLVAGGVAALDLGTALGTIPGLVQFPATKDYEALATVELINPAGGTPTALADMTDGPRALLAALPLGDGSVRLAGGIGPAGASDAQDVYEAAGGAVSHGTLGVPRFGAATFMLDVEDPPPGDVDGPFGDKAIVVGGLGESGEPLSSGYTLIASDAGGDVGHLEMDSARVGAGGAMLATGEMLVAGGLSETSASLRFVATAERYDSGGFSLSGALREARAYGTVSALPDGRLLAVGGLALDQDTDEVEVLDSIELYVTE